MLLSYISTTVYHGAAKCLTLIYTAGLLPSICLVSAQSAHSKAKNRRIELSDEETQEDALQTSTSGNATLSPVVDIPRDGSGDISQDHDTPQNDFWYNTPHDTSSLPLPHDHDDREEAVAGRAIKTGYASARNIRSPRLAAPGKGTGHDGSHDTAKIDLREGLERAATDAGSELCHAAFFVRLETLPPVKILKWRRARVLRWQPLYRRVSP